MAAEQARRPAGRQLLLAGLGALLGTAALARTLPASRASAGLAALAATAAGSPDGDGGSGSPDGDGGSGSGRGRQPHVYLVLIDDAGYNDVGYQSADLGAATPFIDSLAAEGVRLERYYAHT